MRQYVIASLCALFLVGCTNTPTANTEVPNVAGISLRFIGEATLPHRMAFDGTILGGISGIDYDEARDLYYLLSDDRSDFSPARFYTAKIAITDKEIKAPQVTSVVILKRPDGTPFGNKQMGAKDIPDPESIRYRATLSLRDPRQLVSGPAAS